MPYAGQNSRTLAEALRCAQLPASDVAAVALAKRYALLLDRNPESVEVAEKIGPRYLAALTALGLTAAGRRPAAGGKPEASPEVRKRDELRARRDRRRGGAG